MINEIQPKIKFQNIVQCPFKEFVKQITQHKLEYLKDTPEVFTAL